MTNKEKLEKLSIILDNITEEEIICSVATSIYIEDLPDFLPANYAASKHISITDWPYETGTYHNISVKVNPYLLWDDERLFDTNSKLIIDLKKEGLNLTLPDDPPAWSVNIKPKELEQCKPLPEPSVSKIVDLILYKNFTIPMYRDSTMSKNEFLLCYKGSDAVEEIIYAHYVLATVDEDLRNQELLQINEYVEEDTLSNYHRPASHIKAIVCNPTTDKDIKKIKKMLKKYLND